MVLDLCFGEREQINVDEFTSISEEKTSDMVLAVLSLLRERLPCSENYWRYKRNYEMHMKILAGDQARSQDGGAASSQSQNAGGAQSVVSSTVDEECKSDDGGVKKLAKAHMSFIMPLSPYNEKSGSFFRSGGSAAGSQGSGGSRPGSPDMQMGDVPMTEEEVANNFPLQNLKSNQEG